MLKFSRSQDKWERDLNLTYPPFKPVAAPRGGLGGTSPPILTKANFLIRPNLVRKGGRGGGVR